jgi:Leucine-rich repeat (LRR) protein
MNRPHWPSSSQSTNFSHPLSQPPSTLTATLSNHARAASTGTLPDPNTNRGRDRKLFAFPGHPSKQGPSNAFSFTDLTGITPPKVLLNPTWFPIERSSAPSATDGIYKDSDTSQCARESEIRPPFEAANSAEITSEVNKTKLAAMSTVHKRVASLEQSKHQRTMSAKEPQQSALVSADEKNESTAAASVPSDEEIISYIVEMVRAGHTEGTSYVLPKVTVDLSSRNLVQLPEQGVALMQSVVVRMALSHNRIRSLPANFASLHQLRYLNFRYNALQEIPGSIFQLASLEILDVSRNRIKEVPETIKNLTSLKVLAISRNRIQRLPLSLGAMDRLQILKCYDNPLVFPPPETFVLSSRSDTNDPINEEMKVLKQIKEYLANGATRRSESSEF